MLERDDKVRGGRWMHKPSKRVSFMGSILVLVQIDINRHHHYHPCRWSEKWCFPSEFNKSEPPTFYGELNKLEDAKAWLLGMKKFFDLTIQRI